MHSLKDHSINHYKMAVNHLELILDFIEKYNFFTQKMDGFSKSRVLILLGLSAGFGFSTDSILKGNCRN